MIAYVKVRIRAGEEVCEWTKAIWIPDGPGSDETVRSVFDALPAAADAACVAVVRDGIARLVDQAGTQEGTDGP